MELKEMIKVMDHFKNGGEVEYSVKEDDYSSWTKCVNPLWDWFDYNYRIKEPKQKVIEVKKQSFAPYVDETVEPSESYLVFCENYSPWDEDEKNMIRVHSNEESHKMLEILEHHFGIKNNHKA